MVGKTLDQRLGLPLQERRTRFVALDAAQPAIQDDKAGIQER